MDMLCYNTCSDLPKQTVHLPNKCKTYETTNKKLKIIYYTTRFVTKSNTVKYLTNHLTSI